MAARRRHCLGVCVSRCSNCVWDFCVRYLLFRLVLSDISSLASSFHLHTGKAAIENVNTLDERISKIVRNRVFDCHLSPERRQMAIVNIVSSDI